MTIYYRIVRFALSFCLILSPWFYGLTGYNDQLFFAILVFCTCGIGLFSLPHHKNIPLFSFDFIAISFFCLLIYGLIFSVLPHYSLMTVIKGISLIGVFFLTRISVRPDSKEDGDRFLLTIIVFAGVAYSIYGIAQYNGLIDHSYWYQADNLSSRYINGGHFAGFLVMPLFIACAFVLTSRVLLIKILNVVVICLLSWTLILTKSRTVWISIVFGFGVFVFILGCFKILSRKVITSLFLTGITGFFVLWGLKAGDKIISRFSEIWDGQHLNAFSILQRFDLWQGSVRAIAARWWGWGAGTFVHIFPQFYARSDRFLEDYAHNEFLQTGVEYGVIGIIFLILLFVIGLTALVIHIKKTDHANEKIFASAFLACFLTLFISSQFDFPLRIYGNGIFFIIYAAVTAQNMNDSNRFFSYKIFKITQPRWRWLRPILLVSLGGLIFFAAKAYVAHYDYHKGFEFEKDFEWDKAIQSYEKAAGKMPHYADYHEALGRLYRKKAMLTFQKDQKEFFNQKTIQAFLDAIKAHPYWPASYFVLGQIYEGAGEIEKAKTMYYNAKIRDPNNPVYVSAYAYFLLKYGHVEDAVSEFEYFQTLAFREGGPNNACQLLTDVSKTTQDYQLLKRVIRNSWKDHFCLGWSLGELGQWDNASSEFQRTIKMAKQFYEFDDYMAHVGNPIASIYIKHHQKLDKALDIYAEAMSIEPDKTQYRDQYNRVKQLIDLI